MGWVNLWLWPGLLSFLCPQHPSECHTQRTCLTHLCWGCAFMNKLTVFSCSVVVQKWMLHLIAMGAISLVVWLRDLICIVSSIMSFHPFLNDCVASVSSPVGYLHIVSELVHLLWWIPGPQITVSSINNPNWNSFNRVEWDIFNFKGGMLSET